MAFDVCVYTRGDVRGIVRFVKQRPEILINAERLSAWAEPPRVVSELLKHSSCLSNSHCNAGCLTLRLYSA